jgi:hypothetical protein
LLAFSKWISKTYWKWTLMLRVKFYNQRILLLMKTEKIVTFFVNSMNILGHFVGAYISRVRFRINKNR